MIFLKKFLPYFIIAILMLIIFYQWDTNRDRATVSDLKVSTLKGENEGLKVRIATRDGQIQEQMKKMSVDSLKNRVQQEGFKSEIKTMRKRERSSRPDTVEITLVDSVYMADDALILSLTTERNAIQHDCRQLTDSLLAQMNDFRTITMNQDTIVTVLEKKITKLEGQKKWLKIGLGGAGAVILWMAIRD